MRRCLCFLFLLLCLPALGLALELYTQSCFAGLDASATAYAQLLHEFTDETGIFITDTSATSDERWKQAVLSDFAAGNEPDVLFFFAAGADSKPLLPHVVSLEEINQYLPENPLPVSPVLIEEDGRCYAVPVRGYWEALFVNTDVLEASGAPLPDTWPHFLEAIDCLKASGIVPISLSMSDIPHYIAEFVMLSACTPAEYAARPVRYEEIPESWFQGMRLLRELYERGAFAENVTYTTESAASQLFRDKKAAFQLDGSWFADTLDPAVWDSVRVMNMPSAAGDPEAAIGGISMGFYLTRRAWDNPTRRDGALSLLRYLTSRAARVRLSGQSYGGQLAESARLLSDPERPLYRPIQDDMNKAARETWLLTCIPAVAEGRMSAEECWQQVFALSPFQQ